MKFCTYCGRENREEAVLCAECGTAEFKSSNAPSCQPATDRFQRWQFPDVSPSEMTQAFVTLVVCGNLVEADLVVSHLNAADIAAFIPDEFMSQAVAWNLNAFGYVRVQVAPKDYESAKELLLAEPENAALVPEQGTADGPGPNI